MVEVCAICDIAGCHHIRSRAAMTDATPTRAEVEAAVEKLANSHLGMSLEEWNAVSNTILTCAAENQALRERAEAAEAERDEARAAYLAHKRLRIDAEQQAHAARRAEAAAWNDAIEAAAGVAEQYQDCWPRATAPDAQYELKQEYLHMANGAKIVGQQVRALRRAAPTEGEA